MKTRNKILFALLFFVTAICFSQTTEIDGKLSIGDTPAAVATDSVLAVTPAGLVVKVPAQSGDITDIVEASGLEALNEGNGTGWRLIGRDPNNYGNIGLGAIDFSTSTSASSTRGSTGQYTLTFGQNVENNDQYSVMGGLTINDLKSGQGTTYSAANFTYGAYLNIYDNNAVNMFLGERSDIGHQSQSGDSYQNNSVFNTFHNGGGNRVRGGWGSFISGVGLLTGAGASVTVGVGNKDLTQGQYNGAGNGNSAKRFGDGVSQSNAPRLIVGAGTGVNYTTATSGGAQNTNVTNRNNGFVVWGDGTVTAPMQSATRIDSPNVPELSSGTTDATTSNQLVDSGATFLWNQNITAGDIVQNTTDATSTTVVSVDSNTNITLADDIFTTGEDYVIEPKGYADRTLITREYLYNDYVGGSDTSEWATYTGTRVGGDLDVTLGDYDGNGNSTRINIDDAARDVTIEGLQINLPADIVQDNPTTTNFANGVGSMAFGEGNQANSYLEMVWGRFATTPTPGLGGDTSWNSADRLWAIGGGTNGLSRVDLLTFGKDGVLEVPGMDIGEIDSHSGNVLITKDWFNANSGGSPTGLEAIDEGNGIGWRLIGRNAANYGNIGLNAVDFSVSNSASSVNGARGVNSFVGPGGPSDIEGDTNTAFGAGHEINAGTYNSGNFVMGSGNTIEPWAFATLVNGRLSTAGTAGSTGGSNPVVWHSFSSGYANDMYGGRGTALIGSGLIGGSPFTTIVGSANVDLTAVTANQFWAQANEITNPAFIVGIGTINSSSETNPTFTRANGWVTWRDGTSEQPTATIAEIDSRGVKAVPTVEWVNANASGDVTKVGTPANNELGIWTGDGTIEGDSNITWDGGNLGIAKNSNSDYTEITAGSVYLYDDSNTSEVTMSAPTSSGNFTVNFPAESGTLDLKLKAYTVATLPAGTVGDTAYVTDGASVTWRATATGGGSATVMVFYDGTNWIYH